jgi:2-polyprenyl-3-methyl-5-hydroxy-6-metoxy-1,4-benzoquinol methylase
MFGFLNKYEVLLPGDELISVGTTCSIGDTGNWYGFLWDTIPAREYSQAPSGWFDAAKLGGGDLLVSGVARSDDGQRVIKVEFIPHCRKKNDLMRESDIIGELNAAGCVSAPQLLSKGELTIDSIRQALPEGLDYGLELAGISSFRYMIMQYVGSAGKVPLADILVSVFEQKSLGIYHGDVKPANLRFDDARGVCVLIDYDQAVPLSTDVKKLNAEEYLKWCDGKDKDRYPAGSGTWRRHFKRLSQRFHVAPLLKSGALNLAQTTPYKRQATTNTKAGVYHTIKHPVVFADGVRDLRDRSTLLDQVEFSDGETVLDVGCNAGLLVHYLAGRGCRATGIELDPSIVVSAQMVANIIGISASFFSQDLDEVVALAPFDTVCLFSVIHHTRRLEENGQKIAAACKRILIECRLAEHGKKPCVDANGKVRWVKTSVWTYSNENELFAGLSKLFPGFTVVRKVGQSDKNRMLLELIKQ